MKVRIFSEDYPNTWELEWEQIPREEEIISFNHSGGRTNQKVERVNWVFDLNGNLEEVEIHLTY